MDDKAEPLGEGLGREWREELLKLIDECKDGKLEAEDFYLLLIDEISSVNSFFHLLLFFDR